MKAVAQAQQEVTDDNDAKSFPNTQEKEQPKKKSQELCEVQQRTKNHAHRINAKIELDSNESVPKSADSNLKSSSSSSDGSSYSLKSSYDANITNEHSWNDIEQEQDESLFTSMVLKE